MNGLMVFEDIFDAIRHTIQRSGGAKKVGAILFPEKAERAPDAAGRYLLDCINQSRPEKLDAQQLITIMVLGHSHGCHEIMSYLAEVVGYHKPRPITSAERQVELRKDVIEAVSNLQTLLDRAGMLGGDL